MSIYHNLIQDRDKILAKIDSLESKVNYINSNEFKSHIINDYLHEHTQQLLINKANAVTADEVNYINRELDGVGFFKKYLLNIENELTIAKNELSIIKDALDEEISNG